MLWHSSHYEVESLYLPTEYRLACDCFEKWSIVKPVLYLAFRWLATFLCWLGALSCHIRSLRTGLNRPYEGTLRLYGEGEWPGKSQPSNHLCQALACLYPPNRTIHQLTVTEFSLYGMWSRNTTLLNPVGNQEAQNQEISLNVYDLELLHLEAVFFKAAIDIWNRNNGWEFSKMNKIWNL